MLGDRNVCHSVVAVRTPPQLSAFSNHFSIECALISTTRAFIIVAVAAQTAGTDTARALTWVGIAAVEAVMIIFAPV